MKMGKEKKAELTTQQIVLLVILIASFMIMLLLLFRLNLKEQTQAEICHNSVILKEKSTFGGELNCKTSYVCISGGESCKEINPTKTIDINLNPKPTNDETKDDLVKKQVMKAIADEMVGCWWMFGEGKLNYVGGISETHCALCSSIKFDNTIKNEITYGDFFDYLSITKKTDSQTYMQYLFAVSDKKMLKSEYLGVYDLNSKIDLNKNNLIVTGRNSRNLAFFGEVLDPKVMPVYLVIDSNFPKLECKTFITKA